VTALRDVSRTTVHAHRTPVSSRATDSLRAGRGWRDELGGVNARRPRRLGHAGPAVVMAGVALLSVAAAGCSVQPATSRASVPSCTRFGVEAIRQRVTVTALPLACQGLTRAEVNFAVASALHSAAAGAGGKARQRARIAEASRFLQHLVTAVPAQPREPQAPAPAARQPGRTALGLVALGTWLITVGLGLRMGWRMITGWITGGRRRRAPAGHSRHPPTLNLAHFSLATTGLLTWIAYLISHVTGVAWAACALLLPVVGLGMTLVFLAPAASPAESQTAAQAAPGGTPGVPVHDDQRRERRPPVLTVAAHIVFATVTVLFAFLTAVGAS
jgi:hypothetical protein